MSAVILAQSPEDAWNIRSLENTRSGSLPKWLVTVFVDLSAADREVQRILLELLNQMDGFDQNVNVKVSEGSK